MSFDIKTNFRKIFGPLSSLFYARPAKTAIISNISINFFWFFFCKEPQLLRCATLSEQGKQAIRFISGEKEERMEGAKGREGVRKRDVCYILSNLSSWCWGLIAAAKDKWIISCCFHLCTIHCQIAQSQNEGVGSFPCFFSFSELWILFKEKYPSFNVRSKVTDKITGNRGHDGRKKKLSLLKQQTDTRVANVLSALARLQISFLSTTLPSLLPFFLHFRLSLIRT